MSWSANTLTLTAKDWNGVVFANDTVTGDESNASWTVNNIDSTYIKIASVKTVQDPLTAGANDDFGFTTTITEFPDA
jgi:hypothetical protein